MTAVTQPDGGSRGAGVAEPLPVRIVYRSKKISIPLLAAMEATDAWGKAGLDVQHLDYVSGASRSDPMLIEGEVDFIFGSHISPYMHLAAGVPMVCLGQSVNWTTDVLVTRAPVNQLSDLRGKVFAEDSVDLNNHPWGNHKLYLLRAGVDLTEVEFVGANEFPDDPRAFELVADGRADAAIVMPPTDVLAEELGLQVLPLPFLPMVNATTVTTMWSTRAERPELCLAVIRALREGIRYYKTHRDEMLELIDAQVGASLAGGNDRAVRSLYEINARVLDERLYPTTSAIANAFRIAVLQDVTLAERVNPLRLWDIDLLRQLEHAP